MSQPPNDPTTLDADTKATVDRQPAREWGHDLSASVRRLNKVVYSTRLEGL